MIELDVVFGVLAGVAIVAARQPIAELFSTDPDVISASAFILVFVAVQQPVNSVVFALDGILIGAGDLTYLAQTMVIATVIFAALATVVLLTGAGLGWLWAALGVFMLLRAAFMWSRWRNDVWLVTGA